MKFRYCIRSDIGTVRKSNQDRAFAKSLETRIGNSFLGIVCDGMGGLSDGERASRIVVDLFSDWYECEFQYILNSYGLFQNLRAQWNDLIRRAHEEFIRHIGGSGRSMGTTLSALLIAEDHYYVVQLGDSRIYLYRKNSAVQITTDHSYVAELAEKGLMTVDEASVSPEKNVLTRCICDTDEFPPDFYEGETYGNDMFLICSDGFHGGIIPEKMSPILGKLFSANPKIMQQKIDDQISRKKQSGEKDNITALCVMVL